MPFVEGHAHVGHVITPEDRAKGQLNALRAAEKKKDIKLEDLKTSTGWLPQTPCQARYQRYGEIP